MKQTHVILCDIDGTLALLGQRDRFDPTTGEDTLNYPISNTLQVYDNQTVLPVDLILITGREEKYRKMTEEWLKKHGITHHKKLLMRRDGDFRKDFVIKKELYEKEIKKSYDVLFVLEDRDRL